MIKYLLKDNFLLFLFIFLSILIKLPSIFLDLPPYQYCDETIYLNQLLRFGNDWNHFYEFRAGGFNYIPLYPLAFFLDKEALLIAGRVLYNVMFSSFTIFYIFKITKLFSNSKIIIFISLFLFLVSPYAFTHSKIWYPDHYIYFFSSGFFYYLTLILLNKNFSQKYLYLLVFFFSIMISIKYTSLLLFPAFLFVLYKLKTQINDFYICFGYLRKSFYIFILVFSFFNIGLFFNPSEFVKDFLFNINNYSGYSNDFLLDGVIYYSINLFLFTSSFLCIPILFLGLKEIINRSEITFYAYLVIILFFIFYLGLSSGLLINRNVSILIPLIFPILALGFHKLFFFFKNSYYKFIIRIYLSLFLIHTLSSFTFSFSNTLKTDSRVLAEEWLRNNIPSSSSIGTNEFCSGSSPAEKYFSNIYVDKSFTKKYDYYVINSYWKSAIDYKYRHKIPLIFIMNQLYVNYHYSHTSSSFSFNPKAHSVIDDLYSEEKVFEGYGPKIYIMKKKVSN